MGNSLPDNHKNGKNEDKDKIAKRNSPAFASTLRDKLSNFAGIFSSTAAVAAFLLATGFLSDYSLYHLAGLPRLSFSLTSLVESGAQVVIDSLSLIAGSYWRSGILAITFLLLLLLWAMHKSEPIQRWSRSWSLYHTLRLIMLVIGLLLLGGQLDLIQRTLSTSKDMHSNAIVTQHDTYNFDDIPTPFEQLRSIERTGYQLSFFRLPNLAAQHLESSAPSMSEMDNTGIPLRVLNASRVEAQHVYGWLTLCLLLLIFASVLLHLWNKWRANEEKPQQPNIQQPDSSPNLPSPSTPQFTRIAAWLSQSDFKHPIQQMVVPITWWVLALSVTLLPICHGLLARSTIGSESVAVYLKQDQANSEPTRHESDKPVSSSTNPQSAPDARFCINESERENINNAQKKYRLAFRDLIDVRPSRSNYAELYGKWREAIRELAKAVVDSDCEEAIQKLWEVRLPLGVQSTMPEWAQEFRIQSHIATDYYKKAHLGMILNYPRDGEPLTLVDPIQPGSPASGQGRWSLVTIEREHISRIEVLPNQATALATALASDIERKPDDNNKLAELTRETSPDAFAALLSLLEKRRLFAQAGGVAVTQLGRMAWMHAANRPDLSGHAIDLLANLASTEQSSFWTDKGNDIRGASVTALHLTRSPYAAFRLSQILEQERTATAGTGHQECPNSTEVATALTPLRCIVQTPTATGFLLQDVLSMERALFSNGSAPQSMQKTRDGLVDYLFWSAYRRDATDDLRASACSAIINSGIRSIQEKRSSEWLTYLKSMTPDNNPMSLPTCINTLSQFDMRAEQHKEFLQNIYLTGYSNAQTKEASIRAQFSALTTLSELGLDSESPFLFNAFMLNDRTLGNRSAHYLDEADDIAMAHLLIKAIADHHADQPQQTERLLHGLLLLNDNYDGDNGSAQAVADLLEKNDISDGVRQKSCAVLNEYKLRNGSVAKRKWKDEKTKSICSRFEPQFTSNPDTSVRRKLYLLQLDALSSDAN
ncbi:MAG: hypothetical protein M0P59_10035 [Gallionella sp.]|jgi:hypothetical protein|nr:hypothetical protein [Gallionella sp.]MCK9354485.1 hypothetical protein [Gallionella sp.]